MRRFTEEPLLFLGYEEYFLPNPLHTDILKKPVVNFKDGYTDPLEEPGIGLSIDERKFRKYCLKVLPHARLR